MKARKFYICLSLALIYLTLLGNFFPRIGIKTANASSESRIPIKWAVIVMGGYNYYRDLTYNAIQRIEKIMQGRGVSYDLFEDDAIVAPADNPPSGKYALQYANGTLKYQVLVLLFDYESSDETGVNQTYIYWAVGNGTNAVLFNRVARAVPALLKLTPNDVGWDWRVVITSHQVNKTFNDGIKEYIQGSNITMGATLQFHSVVHKHAGMTMWFNKTWSSTWSLGMANTTYGAGNVWYLGYSLNEFRMDSAASKYPVTWGEWKMDFWGHAIKFALDNVERVPVSIMPYKRWKGAWVIRIDTDTYSWRNSFLPPESILQSGWVYDYQFSVLGYGRTSDIGDLPLTNGTPFGYSGFPSSKIMYTNVTGVLQTDLINSKTYKAIIYNSTTGGNYDRIKLDFNENKNFADDIVYKMWENMTYSTVQGKLYWCKISPNSSQPTAINVGWWQTPMIIQDEAINLPKWKRYGAEYGLSYSFHGWQHVPLADGSSYAMWNGTQFLLNITYIREKFDASRYWMKDKFTATGHGFEEDQVVISHPFDSHPTEVDSVIDSLPWVIFQYPGQMYYIGFGKKSATSKYTLSSSRQEDFYTYSAFASIEDIVKTLYPVISTLTHFLGYNTSFWFPPYTNSIKPANPRDAFTFWINAKYMLENTPTAYYESDKITLEFRANSTLKDFVWKFPIEYNGKYFNGFSDNRTVGKIKHFDGKYVYIEFTQGQGGQRLEVTYGSNPHIYETSSYIENINQTYTAKNLTLQLWNASGSINVKVDCTRLGQPNLIKINGAPIEYNHNPATNICSFNVTLNDLVTIQLLWTHAPPNPATPTSPLASKRFDPAKSVTFTWNFSDPDPGDSQYAYRFQLDDDSDFTSPIIDTEKVTSNLTITTQPLPNKVGLYYWRVKTWDKQDAEGDWSVSQAVIVDRLKITLKGVTDDRTDIGASVYVYFNISMEYDGTLFEGTKGTVYINDSIATWDEENKFWKLSVTQISVGKWTYQVSNITDIKYGVTAINDPAGAQQVIWDKVIVTITPDATNVMVGTKVNFKVTAIYAYDNKNVSAYTVDISKDGVHFATSNFTDTSAIASTHQYKTEKVTEATYSLNAFTSNSPTITWKGAQKTFIQMLSDLIASNALIVLTTVWLIFFIFLFIRKRRINANQG